MPPKKPSKGKRKSKQILKFPESTGKNPCGNTASTQIGLAIEHLVVPSRLAIQPAAAHPPQPRLHSAQLMAGPSMAPYVRSLQQGLPHMYNMTVSPLMAMHVWSPQQWPPQMNPLSQDTMGGASTMSHPQFVERRPPQMDLPSRDFMVGPLTVPHAPFLSPMAPQIPPSSHQSMAGPSTIPRTSFLPQMARQIPPSNQQSMAGTSAIPPAQFEQRMPSQSTTPFQYQSCLQAPVLNVEGIHQAADNYRPGLRMRADHSDALLCVPSVCAASQAALYEAYHLVMAYAKPRPGELVQGEEFSTGVIHVVPRSSRAVRKPVHLRLPPVEPAGTGHIAQPGLGSPAITDQPLMSNSTQPPPLSSATISRIVDSTCNVFKRDFLNNLMVASNDLKDMALHTFNQGVEMHLSPLTMNSVNAWVAGSQKTEVKKLKTILNSI
ncbi:hypothetical protein BDR07DRAFT_1486220 [Suillus spraguei]|nr:hypothetical protein BDR07DRAFT_1486220 [Suillus spraguei]